MAELSFVRQLLNNMLIDINTDYRHITKTPNVGGKLSKPLLFMKSLLTIAVLLIIGMNGYGQDIIYEDFKKVIPVLQKEDFKTAFEQTSQMLESSQNDSSDLRGIVIYMNIFAAAGMVSLNQMNHDNFLIYAKKYIGQRLVMSSHPCIDSSSRSFNALKFVTENGELQGMTITANRKGTSILCFEYFRYADAINPADYFGKNVRCGGILESVEVNPNKSTVWISRLRLKESFIREMSSR